MAILQVTRRDHDSAMSLLTPFKYSLRYTMIHMLELRGILSRGGQGPVYAGDRKPQSHRRNEAREDSGKTVGLLLKVSRVP